jgi:hypothetical protein
VLARIKSEKDLIVPELDALLKWKLGKPFHKTRMIRYTKLKKWLDVKNLPYTESLLHWEPRDEEALEPLRRKNITIKETALQRKVEEKYIDHHSSITYSLFSRASKSS